jgi:hypothetical protein
MEALQAQHDRNVTKVAEMEGTVKRTDIEVVLARPRPPSTQESGPPFRTDINVEIVRPQPAPQPSRGSALRSDIEVLLHNPRVEHDA